MKPATPEAMVRVFPLDGAIAVEFAYPDQRGFAKVERFAMDRETAVGLLQDLLAALDATD